MSRFAIAIAIAAVAAVSGCTNADSTSAAAEASGTAAATETTWTPDTDASGTVATSDTTQTTRGDFGTGSSSGGIEPGTSTAGGPESTTSTVDVDPGPARGIAITEVRVSQGIDLNPSATYAIEALPNRQTLIRFFLDIDEALWNDISPDGRYIEGRTTIRTVDGEEHELEPVRKWILRDSTPYTLDTVFEIEIPEAWAVDGVQTRLTLHEIYPELAELPLPEVVPDSDWQTLDIAAQPVPARLRVMAIPIAYQGDCTATTVMDEAFFAEAFAEAKNLLPVSDLEVEIHAPVTWNVTLGHGQDLSNVLSAVASLRAQENPAPDVYYAGFIDICSDCPDCSGGQGYFASPTIGDAPQRASINRVYAFMGDNEARNAGETVAHELGHNHNRRHNPCANPVSDPGPTDRNYPHADGAIGIYGYRFSNQDIIVPTGALDFMSYCEPVWVSDYTWDRIGSHIRALQQAVSTFAAGPTRPQLFVALGPNGEVDRTFWAEVGASDTLWQQRVRATTDTVDGDQRAQVHEVGDGDGQLWRVDFDRLPAGGRVILPAFGRDITVTIPSLPIAGF